MTEPLVASLIASLVLAAVQLAPRVLPEGTTGDDAPLRSLSLAGGFSVAFVFLHLLPELEEAGDPVADALGHLLPFTDAAAHLLALVGLITLYGLERFARSTSAEADAVDRTVRVEVAAFASYYAIVGLLTWDRAASGLGELLTFTIAVGLHFLVVDWAFARRRRRTYRRVVRPVLSGAILTGWTIGAAVDLPSEAIGAMTSFLAGGVILVALKEELPEESRGRFGWFALGAVLYAGALALGQL